MQRRTLRPERNYVALIIPYPTGYDHAATIARKLTLELGQRVEPIRRTSSRARPHFDLRLERPLHGQALRRAHRTIEGFRPSSTSAPATE